MTSPGEQSVPPELSIGNHSAWVAAYESLAEAESTLSSVVDRYGDLSQILTGAAQDARAFHSMQEIDPGYAESGAASKVVEDASDALMLYVAATQESGVAAQKLARLQGLVSLREWEFGRSIAGLPAAGYVIRAIGACAPVIGKRWTQVRGEIEIFRQLTGETRSNRTLGPGRPEEWATRLGVNIVGRVQRIQMGQLMLLNADPALVAEAADRFGKQPVIEECGLPPQIPDEQIGLLLEGRDGWPIGWGWLTGAMAVCQQIEPHDQGLAIDRV